jgi:hypothetical protein
LVELGFYSKLVVQSGKSRSRGTENKALVAIAAEGEPGGQKKAIAG